MGGGGWGRRGRVGTIHTCTEPQGSWHQSRLELQSSKAGADMKRRRKSEGSSHLKAQEIGHLYKLWRLPSCQPGGRSLFGHPSDS